MLSGGKREAIGRQASLRTRERICEHAPPGLVIASQNLAVRPHDGRSQQSRTAASGHVLNWFWVKRGIAALSLLLSIGPVATPVERAMAQGASPPAAQGTPPRTAQGGSITDRPGRASVTGPGRASPAARIETRSTAVRRETSPHMAWLCRPTRYSGCRIRRAAARILPASTLLLSIPQLWWPAFRTVLVGLGEHLLRTMDSAGF
jgi:hypothetical protein